MPDISIKFNPSLGSLIKKFEGININSFLQDYIVKLAYTVERESKRVAPVDTGRMRASISVGPIARPLYATIAPHTDYAIYVHEGTRYMTARPFMLWGAEASTQNLDQKLSVELESFIQGKIK